MATLANCTLSCETRHTCSDCFGYIPTNPISSDLWVVWEPVPVLLPKPCAMEHVWKAAMNRAEKFRLLLEQKGASDWLHEQKAYRRPQTQIHTGIIHRKIHALYIQFFSKRSGIDMDWQDPVCMRRKSPAFAQTVWSHWRCSYILRVLRCTRVKGWRLVEVLTWAVS